MEQKPLPQIVLESVLNFCLTIGLYHGYTNGMKTAISLPDTLFSEADTAAKRMGIPRSQLFSQALEEYLEKHKSENITDSYNRLFSSNETAAENTVPYASLESLRELTKNDTW